MNKTKIKKIREEYQNIKNQISQSLNRTEDIDIDGDDVDKIQGDAISDMLQKISKRDMVRLERINFALSLPDERFDECEECGLSIGEKRLMVIPGVRICISCAEEAEKNAKMFA